MFGKEAQTPPSCIRMVLARGNAGSLLKVFPNCLRVEESRQTRITELVPPWELWCDNVALGSATHLPSTVNRYWCVPVGNSICSVQTPPVWRTIGLASGDQLLNSPARHTFWAFASEYVNLA